MNPIELITQLEAQDFNYWLDDMLSQVPDKLDKREGSIIYDALAPAATQLAIESLNQANLLRQVFPQTAEGEFLDWHAESKGTTRQPATFSEVTAKFLDSDNKPINNVEVTDRFASIGDDPFFYTVAEVNGNGTGLLRAELSGTGPNRYIGQILPVTPNDSLSWAEITEISVPARDSEDDEHLRARSMSSNSYIAYGGNIADYQDMLSRIETVGAGQIYPSWQGGGTVKLVVLNNDYLPASTALVNQVQEMIDPAPQGEGYGLAPIDHVVTVVAPEKLLVNIATHVTVQSDMTILAVQDKINAAIEDYFDEQRRVWNQINNVTGRGYSLTIYRSQLLSKIMAVPGVVNATLPKLNDVDGDVSMKFTNEVSQLPLVGEVTLDA